MKWYNIKNVNYFDTQINKWIIKNVFGFTLDSNGANRECIYMLMGHVSKDVSNRVYNHKTLEELRTAIELFKI